MSKATGNRECTAKTAGPVSRFECTRPQGHSGKHEAQGINGLVVKRWAPR